MLLMIKIAGGGATNPVRLREEKTEFPHENRVDLRDDSDLLRRHVCRPYLRHRHHHCNPNRLFQGSHCHCKRTKPAEESTFHKIPELVFFGDDHVLSLRRECHLLLQTYRFG